MTWAYPSVLWGLLGLPVLAAASWAASGMSLRRLENLGLSGAEWQVRAFLRDFAMISFAGLMILSAADPRSGRRPLSGERSGLDVAVAFDVSRSMLARDLSPNRLDGAVDALRQTVSALSDSRFSLTPFKGDARLAVPMTEDRVILEFWTGRLGPGVSTVPGTDIEAALRVAEASFPEVDGRSRIILLITDGEALEGRVGRISRELAEDGLPIHILAAGSAEGGTIVLENGEYVKDSSGRPVVTRADTAALKRLAEETGGSFHDLSRPAAVSDLVEAVESGRQFSEARGIHFVGVGRYRVFLVPALLMLVLYLLGRILPWRKK